MAAGAKGGRRNKRRRELKRKARLRERLLAKAENDNRGGESVRKQD